MSKVYLNAPLLHSTIVAWVVGIVISLVFIGNAEYGFSEMVGYSMPALIIGGLLIYTLRDKKR